MTDLELTKLCAQAMGISYENGQWFVPIPDHTDALGNSFEGCSVAQDYDPLRDDAQAMALVKKFRLCIDWFYTWSDHCQVQDIDETLCIYGADLNRAICKCVAKMETAK